MKTNLNSIVCALSLFALPVGAQTSALVSGSARPSATGGGGSYQPVLSPDGRFVAFVSQANNLVTNDNLASYMDVFLRDRIAERTTLVSLRVDGAGGGDDNSVAPSVSADGRYVAFQSAAGNLAPNDTNGLSDVFLRDLVAGTTVLVSRELGGVQAANGVSTSPILSTNGRWLVFESTATNLVANDTNGLSDVFLFDRETGANSLVSLNGDGSGSRAGASLSPAISANGTRVAYVNILTNVVPALSHVFVRDLQAGTTTCVSSNVQAELPGYLGALRPVFSADGSVVLFHAFSASLTNLYRFHFPSGTHSLVGESTQAGSTAAPSEDGRFVAYVATNLVMLWDAQSGNFPLATSTAGPARPAISADGNKICFLSNAGNLTGEPTNGLAQLYLRDFAAGSTILLSGDTNGATSGDLGSIVPVMNADGNVVAFESPSSTMVADDLNRAPDVFVRDVVGGTTALISGRASALPSVTGPALATVYPNAISADGRYVAYGSMDNGLFPGDTNGVQDIFVRDLVNGTVEPASVSSTGEFTNTFHSLNCVLSGDGRHVAYVMSSLLSPDSRLTAVFWRDLDTGETRPISEQPGTGPWALSGAPTISADGRWVAFQTIKRADFFEPGIQDRIPANSDVILSDVLAGTNYVVSQFINSNFFGNNFTYPGESITPILSPDGRWLAYLNTYSCPSCPYLLYVRDLHSNVTTLVNSALPRAPADPVPACHGGVTFSRDSSFVAFNFTDQTPTLERNKVFVYDLQRQTGAVVCAACQNPSLSGDGRYVVVETRAYTPSDVVLYDRQTGVTNLISAASGTLSRANGRSYSPIISGDARFVVFVSRATDIDPADTDHLPNIYVHDRVQGATMALRPGLNSSLGDGPSYTPVMSADGRTVAFSSFANDLVSSDYNGRRDVFVVRLGSPDTDGDGLDDDWEVAFFNDLSRDGNGDFDQDGQSDRAEFLSGTDPTNTGSVLRALTVTPVSGKAVTVYWTAVPGRTYLVQYKDNVAAGWTTISGQVTAPSTTASKVDSGATLPAQRFYRVVLP